MSQAYLNMLYTKMQQDRGNRQYWQDKINAYNESILMTGRPPKWLEEGITSAEEVRKSLGMQLKRPVGIDEPVEYIPYERLGADEQAKWVTDPTAPYVKKRVVSNPYVNPFVEVEEETVAGQNQVTFNVDEILRKEIEAQEFQEELDRKRALSRSYGQDMWPNGTVVSFTKKMLRNSRTERSLEEVDYQFAAVRAEGLWFLTGPNHNPAGMTWANFILWLIGGDFPVQADDVSVMSSAGTLASKNMIEGRTGEEIPDRVDSIPER